MTNLHRSPPMNQSKTDLGIVNESQLLRFGINAAGGILTIMNTNQFQPAPIYENIVWINRSSISVWGDVFIRRQ
jgi:hypothetical protein